MARTIAFTSSKGQLAQAIIGLCPGSRGGAEAILASLPILKSALILAAFKFAHCNVFRHCLDDLAGDPGPYPSQLFSLHHREPRT